MGTIASRARLTSQFQGAPNSGVAPIGDSAAPIWGLAPIGDFTGTDRSSPMDSCARSPNWLPPAPLVVPVHSHRFGSQTAPHRGGQILRQPLRPRLAAFPLAEWRSAVKNAGTWTGTGLSVDHFTPTFRGQKPKVDQKMSDLELRSAELPPHRDRPVGSAGRLSRRPVRFERSAPPQPLPGTAWLPLQRPR